MNTGFSTAIGWGSLCVAAGVAWHFASKDINKRETAMLEAVGYGRGRDLDSMMLKEAEEEMKKKYAQQNAPAKSSEPSSAATNVNSDSH